MTKAIERPFTLDELRAMQDKDGSITAVISWPWDETGDIEHLNDSASELITGSEVGLEDISYKLVGADVEAQEVLIEVTGTVENWLAEQEEERTIPPELDEIMDGWSDADAFTAYDAFKAAGGADADAEGFEAFLENRQKNGLPPYDKPV
jgi:hypothetical protein